jgi:tetratricopeptide (TPR) repeat protein
MRIFLHLLFVLFLLAGISCKQRTGAQGKGNDVSPGFGSPTPDRDDAMTANRAREEEIFVRGCIEKSLGNKFKAFAQFQQVLELNPNNAAANYELAGLCFEMGQEDRALRYAKAAADLNPGNRWYRLRYAEMLQVNGKQEEATKVYKDLSDTEPENIDLLFRYASALQKSGNTAKALEVYNRIEALEGNSDTLGKSRLLAYQSANDIAGEEKTLLELIAAFPGDVNHYYMLGEFYSRTNQPEKAIDIYGKTAVKFPWFATPHLRLAAIYQSQNKHDLAFTEATLAFEIADALTEKLNLVSAWYPVSDSSAALSAVQKKETDSLCRALRRVHPDQPEPYLLSGDYLYREGKYKEARDQYRKGVSIRSSSYESWKRILEINERLNDNVSQQKDCETVIEIYPTQPDAYYYLGAMKFAKKDYAGAVSPLESTLDYTIGNPAQEMKIKLLLIDACRASGDAAKADTYSEQIIAKDSTNLPVIAAYCASLAERRKKLVIAEQLMLDVIAKEPGNAEYLETLSWIKYQMHEYPEAKNYMENALAKTPDNARMNERMGDIQFRLGNVDEALVYWNKAKTKGGTNPALERKISSKTMLDNE